LHRIVQVVLVAQLVVENRGDQARAPTAKHTIHADPELQALLLDELELHVPSADDLRKRRVLDSLLARGLGIDAVLQDRALERRQRPIVRDGQQSTIDVEINLGTIAAVDEHRFVLTLDFTMKMLCMHERIECRVPCIMEGETGVSKTALTRMYFILKNLSSMSAQMQDVDNPRLRVTVDQLRNLAAAQQPPPAAPWRERETIFRPTDDGEAIVVYERITP
jgi:hypothetical protein